MVRYYQYLLSCHTMQVTRLENTIFRLRTKLDTSQARAKRLLYRQLTYYVALGETERQYLLRKIPRRHKLFEDTPIIPSARVLGFEIFLDRIEYKIEHFFEVTIPRYLS